MTALEQRRIAGAALDVFDHEPQVPDALKCLNNVILTPHVAGLSPEATQGTVELVGKNLVAYFSGQPVLTPIELPLPTVIQQVN
ncbi:putative 2-hydroxyacid dehydrogenase [compost metagenome]